MLWLLTILTFTATGVTSHQVGTFETREGCARVMASAHHSGLYYPMADGAGRLLRCEPQ